MPPLGCFSFFNYEKEKKLKLNGGQMNVINILFKEYV